MKTRALVAEDFKPFRDLICSMLNGNGNIHIECTVGDGTHAVEKAAELQPHLVLMDIGLPGLNGIEAARRIRAVAPRSKIVFLTQECSAEVVAEALATGAHGYVVKADAGTELLVAIDIVLRDGNFVSKRCGSLLTGSHTDGNQ